MDAIDNLPYRLGVGMMIRNSEGEIFVGKRIDTRSEAWQMPQGGIDNGETPKEAALREVKEEVGTANVTVLAESNDWYYYDLPHSVIPDVWGGKYRGQKQKWFVLQFDGVDSEINIQTEHPEFLDWRWVEAEQLADLIVPFKRKLYRALIEEFAPLLSNR